MKNGFYLTSDDFPEYQSQMAQWLESESRLRGGEEKYEVQNITFVVTENCNLNCTYCYEKRKTSKVMSRETARDAIDAILDESWVNGYYDVKKKPAVILEFFGGEPLLNIDVIDYATEYFKYRANRLNHPWAENYMINITSNGTLYFDGKVQDYIKRNSKRLALSITIDGNKKLHDKCRLFPDGRGSYDIVEKAVKDYNRNFTDQRMTKITLSPDNIMFLTEALKDVFDLGIECAFANCCFEEGWQIEHARIFYKELRKLADFLLKEQNYTKCYTTLFDETIGEKLREKRNWCGGNGEMLAIGTDGNCYPCIRFMDYSLEHREGRPVGNIYTKLDSTESNCFLCALKKIDMDSQCQFEDNKKCLDCPISSGCSLCTGYNYDYYGDPNHKATFICEMHRARVLANVYFWNSLYKKLGLDKQFKLNLGKDEALKIIDEREYDALLKLGGE